MKTLLHSAVGANSLRPRNANKGFQGLMLNADGKSRLISVLSGESLDRLRQAARRADLVGVSLKSGG